MNRNVSTLLYSALVACAWGVAHAQTRTNEPIVKTVVQAVEAPAGTVTLPSNAGGPLVMPACYGCALKTYKTTAATEWFVGGKPSTLTHVRTAANSDPTIALTISYSVETNEIQQVSAAL